MRLEFAEKFLPARFRTFHKDFHILCIILNPPRQGAGLLPCGRQRAPEANTMSHAVNANGNARGRATHHVVTIARLSGYLKPFCGRPGPRFKMPFRVKKSASAWLLWHPKRHKFLTRRP